MGSYIHHLVFLTQTGATGEIFSKVIDYLNFLLAGELGARDQYFIHSQMYAE